MGYKQLINQKGRIVTAKKVNKLSSQQSYIRTIRACTIRLKYFELQSTDYGFQVLVQFYFNIIKIWAVASHNTLDEFYKSQRPVLYRSTLSRYCSGHYTRVEISRLFGLFSYFKYNTEVHDKLLAVGCDLNGCDFIDNFLKLVDVPLLNGERFNRPFEEGEIIAKRYKKVHPQK